MSGEEVKPGYKRTEVGVIPDEWDIKFLEKVFTLKHGFAFSSEYFFKSGPVVLTPGNFKIEGGLYFEERNTKRYSGNYTPAMTFRNGDLLIVMTDLTPECNLLGKPAFIESDETVLHNQRIGRVQLKNQSVDLQFLFYLLLSQSYLGRIKEQATGSTVRHTSSKSIYCVQLAWPQLHEQRTIATALSDVDALLAKLDQLIAKKRDLKQATMQQLLTGQTRLPGFSGAWQVKRLGEIAEVSKGVQLHSNENHIGGDFPHYNGGISPSGFTYKTNAPKDSIAISEGGNSCGHVQLINQPFWCGGHCYLVTQKSISKHFLYHALKGRQNSIMELRVGSGLPNVQKTALLGFSIELPVQHDEQTAIAAVLSDMDTELAALESRRDKTRTLKQGMMQELLTGRIRLV